MEHPNLIGIAGRAGAGKDLAYKLIRDITGIDYVNKKFSLKIKEVTSLITGVSTADLERHDVKESPMGPEWDTVYHQACNWAPPRNGFSMPEDLVVKRESLTPRRFMQLLGTEFGRDMIHPDIWVNALFSDYNSDYNWIITDVRFPNEILRIKREGGITIRLVRDGNREPKSDHASEAGIDKLETDYVINAHDELSLKNELINVLNFNNKR